MKRNILILLTSLAISFCLKAQVKMDITTLQLNMQNTPAKSSWVVNGDTLGRDMTDIVNIPKIHIGFSLRNDSNVDVMLYPLDAQINALYKYQRKIYNHKVYISSEATKTEHIYILHPKEEKHFTACGSIMGLETDFVKIDKNIEYYVPILLEILPTLRFQYYQKDGLTINQHEIDNVVIKNFNSKESSKSYEQKEYKDKE